VLQTILFTTDDEILDLVADNDETFEVDAMNELQIDTDINNDDHSHRPSTADDDTQVAMI